MPTTNKPNVSLFTMISLSVFLVYTLVPAVPALLPQPIRYFFLALILIFELLGTIQVNKEINESFILYLLILLLLVLLYLGKWKILGTNFVSFFASYYLFWLPLLYTNTLRKSNYDSEKIWILIVLCMGFTLTTTIIGCLKYTNISRLLAGKITGDVSLVYTKQNIGGYGLIYGAVLLISSLFWHQSIMKKTFVRIFDVLLICLIIYSVVITQYTIALIISALIIALCIIFKSNNKFRNTIMFLIAAIVFLCFRIQIANFIIAFVNNSFLKDYNFLSDRLLAFGKMLLGDSSSSDVVSRKELYSISWNLFLKNPIFGCLFNPIELGGHSEIIDILGGVGLFGLSIYATIFGFYLNIINTTLIDRKLKVKVLLVVPFIILSLFNTANSPAIAISLFLAPFLLMNMEKKNER